MTMHTREIAQPPIDREAHRLLLALRIGEQRAFKAFREGMPKYEAPMGSDALLEAVDEKEREEAYLDDTIRR